MGGTAEKKSPVTPPGIDPGTLRLAAQCLNHYATPVPKNVTNLSKIYFLNFLLQLAGRGSSVSIATRYGLDGPGIESRCGKGFSAPVQTGPGAHLVFYTMGTESFPGVKRPGRGVDSPLLSSAEVKERVELYLHSTSGSSWPVIG